MKSIALSLLGIFCTLSAGIARQPDLDSAEMWSGTWKRTDGGQTMTINFKRDSIQCTISYSKGTPDTGKMRGDGEIIDFEGSTHGGMDHSSGTLTMSADHTKITKNQAVFGQDGPEKHLSAIYVRSGKSLSDLAESESAGDRDIYSYFGGTYQSTSNPNDKITVKVHGDKAAITFALGGQTRAGTIREGGEIEYTVSSTQRGTMVRSEGGGIDARVVSKGGHVETERYVRIR